MGDYKKAGKKKVEGKKTPVVVYKKTGSSKLYVMRKGRMMSYVNYKKMCAKKLMAKVAKKVSKVRKVRKGGESCNHMQGGYETSVSPEGLTNPPGNFIEDMTSENMDTGSYDGGRSLRRQRQQRQQRQKQQKQQKQKQQIQKQKQQIQKQQRQKQRGGEEKLHITTDNVQEMIQMPSEPFTNSEGGFEKDILGGAKKYRRSSRSKQSVRKQSTRSRSRSRSRSKSRISRK